MIICAVCLHSVPPQLEKCPFCEAPLEAQEGEEVNEAIQWEIVRTVSTEVEATLIAGRLRAYGVPAFVLSQVDSTRHFTVGALAVAKVFVPESYRDEAEQILAQPPDPLPEDEDQGSSTDTNHSNE